MTPLPGVTWVLLALLGIGVVLPLVGMRGPATRQSQAAQTPIVPGSEGMIASLREAPARAISNPRRAAVVSGIAFGRTENIAPADSQMFRDSGLWHLLTRGQVARTHPASAETGRANHSDDTERFVTPSECGQLERSWYRNSLKRDKMGTERYLII